MGSGLTLLGTVTTQLDDDGITPDGAGVVVLGREVQRPTAALPAATTPTAIFTVAGGRVAILQLLGEVTTVIQTQACNLKVQGNPTASGSSVDLCADLNISAKAVATLFGISGVFADALLSGLAIPAQSQAVIVQAGTVDIYLSATNTGSVKWTARWVPIDAGATLVAA